MMEVNGWSGLLQRIGAPLSDWRYVGPTSAAPPDWKVTLAQVGIEVGLDEITIDQSTGLYLFKGQQVLIYIKFTMRPREVLEHDRNASPRFHFRDCRTIQAMKDQDRYQRYVAIARTDGHFPVVSREITGEALELEARLGPCKNCLTATDYKGYAQSSPRKRAVIWDRFSIDEFFAMYSSFISHIPIESCSAVDPRRYSADWEAKSEEVRSRADWKCSICHVHLGRHRRLLHVHHKDRDKQNNWRHNLQPLCVMCHRSQPGHKNMYVSATDTATIRRLRREQGLAAE